MAKSHPAIVDLELEDWLKQNMRIPLLPQKAINRAVAGILRKHGYSSTKQFIKASKAAGAVRAKM